MMRLLLYLLKYIAALVFCHLVLLSVHADSHFTNVTKFARVDYDQGDPINLPLSITQQMTGGAAARDFDSDGWPDLVVTRFDDAPILYRNMRNGTFDDVTAAAGLGVMTSHNNGVAWGDVDNDGHADLYIMSALPSQPHHLFMNRGDGMFDEEAMIRGASVATMEAVRYGTSVAFGDYDRDGWLDIHVNEWGHPTQPPALKSHARLLRNNGAAIPGTFSDVTLSSGVYLDNMLGSSREDIDMPFVLSFASRFTDLDQDGYPDLVIASDFNTSRLYWNNRDGTFTDGTTASNFGTDENGMGLAVGDYDADGQLDVFITSIYHTDPAGQDHNEGGNWGVTGNRLYRNMGNRQFSDATDSAQVRKGDWGWGTTFFDYNNDQHLDLMMTNGILVGDFETDRSLLWKNVGGGVFEDVSLEVGVTDSASGKGLLTFDYDNDGDLDVFIVNNGQEPVLYRNDQSDDNAWLKLKLVGSESNRDGIGALVTVTPDLSDPTKLMIRELDGGSNFLSQNDLIAHFGLGASTDPIAQVSIRWPSGMKQDFLNISPNATYVAYEGTIQLDVFAPDPIADTDQDADVDNDDLMTVLGSFSGPEGVGMNQSHGDTDGDGDVDDTDLQRAIDQFTGPGNTNASVSPIPNNTDPAHLLYDSTTGNVSVDASRAPGGVFAGLSLTNNSPDIDDGFFESLFVPLPFDTLTVLDNELSMANGFSASGGLFDLGAIMPAGLDLSNLQAFLTQALYVGQRGTGVRSFELHVIPESSTFALCGTSLALLLHRRGKRGR